MRGFKLDENGDVVIKDRQIQFVEDKELLIQTIKTLLATKKGEWIFNSDEGIDELVGKDIQSEEIIQNNIEQALKQVDDTLSITELNIDFDKVNRKLYVNFKATNSQDETIEISQMF